MRKKLSSIVASITIASIILNHIQSIPVLQNAEAASFRTTYTVFGDLNDDKVIDSFDVILMRGKVADGNYDKNLDFNCDDKVDSDDLTLLSDYVLGKNCIFDAYLCEDADEDYICDMLEVAYLKSNPDSKDSDGDTLTDFEEVVYTNTSPTDKYTRNLTVTDADDDADGDKLTNKEELSLDTSPLLADSDEDEISDYEEINEYNTDPNDDDSDDDNITDGDEIKLGLKPDSDKSNGITYDYERTFNNKIPASSELLSYINVEESPYEVSIDIKSAGNVDKALSAHIGDFSNTSEDERVIGRSVSFSYDEKLSVDSAKIYFKPYDVNESIENYLLFQFFPETNYLLPVETKYTKDSAYVETSELGTFCLVDTKDLIDSKVPAPKDATNSVQILGDDIKVSSNDLVWDYTLDETEVLFYIDISNCATDTVESTKQSILDFSEALFEHCDNAAIQIIGYDFLSNVSGAKIQEYSDSNGSEILINLTSVVEAIEKIETDTQVAENDLDMAIYYLNNKIRDGLFSSECENKYVFITSDSSLSLTQDYTGYWYNGVLKDTKAILEEMNTEGIHVNTLFSDSLLDISRAVKGIKYYKDACDEFDFGVYTKSSTGYFGNTGYARVYSDAISNIQSMSVMYTCSVSPNAIPSTVERNAFINSLPSSYDKSKVPDADSNGNISFKDAAVKVGAATLDKNGNLVFKNMYNACDESDLTRNGYEQLTENMETSKKLVWDSFQITPFSDKILYNDDDGDGIPNKYDPYPDEAFDERFEIVNDYSYEPSIDYVERHYQKSQDCYRTIKEPNILGKSLAVFFVILHDSETFADVFEPLLNQTSFDFGEKEERKKDSSALSHAFDAMQHYLWGNGKELYYSERDTSESISSSVQNLTHFFDIIDRTMRCSEEMLKTDNTVILNLKSNQKLKIACLIKDKSSSNPIPLDPIDIVTCDISECSNLQDHREYYCNYVHRDWNLTTGECLGTIVAEVVRNGDEFNMNYRFYFKDIYEWAAHEENDPLSISAILHGLHEAGLAQEYLMQGHLNGSLSWNLNEGVTTRTVAQQLFMTLADKENGLGDNQSYQWIKSNEVERFKKEMNID